MVDIRLLLTISMFMFPSDPRLFVGQNFLINGIEKDQLFYIKHDEVIESFYLDEEVPAFQETLYRSMFWEAFDEASREMLEEYNREYEMAHKLMIKEFMQLIENRPQKVFNKDLTT